MADCFDGEYPIPAPRIVRAPRFIPYDTCREEWQPRLHTLKNGQLRVMNECQCCYRRDAQTMRGVERAARERGVSVSDIMKMEKTNVAAVDAIYEFTLELFALEERHYQKWNEKYNSNRPTWWDWYNRYLLTGWWEKKRKAAFARDNYKCVSCGGKATEVHHLTYERAGREHLEDLASMCFKCHDAQHARTEHAER